MKECNFGKIVLAFVAGAAAGVAVGMLFAPDKGSETRKKIANKARKISGDVQDKFTNLRDRAEELINEIRGLGQSIDDEIELEEEEV